MPPSSTGSAASWRAACQQLARSAGLPAGPGVPGRRERQLGPLRTWPWSTLPRVRTRPGPRRRRRDARHGTRRPRGPRRPRGRVLRPRRRGATPPGRSLRPRPGRRPARGGRSVAAPRWRPGRGPSAPAGDAPARVRPSATSSPDADGGLESLLVRTPRVAAAARTTARSPVSSAAASSSTDCTGAGSCSAAVQERLLDPGGQVQLGRQRGGPAELVRGELGGELEQRQRVAAGLDDEPFGDLRRGRDAQPLLQQGPGRVRVEAGQHQLVDAVGAERCRGLVAGGEDQEHAVRAEPAGAEQQRVRGGGVEPVGVLDDAQHGRLLGRGGQQRQGRHRHQERLDRRAVLFAERDPQRPRLRDGEALRAAASPGAAAGAARRTPTAPRPPGPGCAAPTPHRHR